MTAAVTPQREQQLAAREAQSRSIIRRVGSTALAVPAGLFAVGLVTRILTGWLIHFPASEGSAYYVAVARNLVGGRGFEIDAIWSYATPPLTLPRPAFELWQPLASVLAAAPMTVLGPTFDAAQLGFALLGAFLGPLAWLVARDAARRLSLDPRRTASVALGAGVLSAVSGPLLLSSVIPDSTLPFTIAAVGACLLMPRAMTGDPRALAGLGTLLGVAYLVRMEAVYLGATFFLLALAGGGARRAIGLAAAVATVGGLVAAPWWLRNLSVFGTPMPGQLADNAFLTANEQIFAYAERPSLEAFLAQGVDGLASNVGVAAWHNLVDVLIVPGGIAAALGLLAVAIALGRRRGRTWLKSPLGALMVAGSLTFAATTVLFPVATLWGTFEHASGPLVVGLIVAALVAADAVVARIRAWRDWPRSNAWLAPAALVALTLPVAASLVIGASASALSSQALMAEMATRLPPVLASAGVSAGSPLISDRPIWLSDALDWPVIALPAEEPAQLLDLAADFGAQAVVVIERRGEFPAALRAPGVSDCFGEVHGQAADAPAVFVIQEACR